MSSEKNIKKKKQKTLSWNTKGIIKLINTQDIMFQR